VAEHCCACATREDATALAWLGTNGDDKPLTDEQSEVRERALRYLKNAFDKELMPKL
jgi:hypothetical protein